MVLLLVGALLWVGGVATFTVESAQAAPSEAEHADKQAGVRAGGFDLVRVGKAGTRAVQKSVNNATPTIGGDGERLEITTRGAQLVIVVPESMTETRKMRLDKRKRREIRELAAFLSSDPQWRYQIVGPLKERESKKEAGERWRRSASRALEIADQLVRAGVHPSRLSIIGDGTPGRSQIEIRLLPRRGQR
jgi:outer membrane protein OmpA-like peptidoglycan-associated protein